MQTLTPQDVNKYLTTIRLNFENAYKVQTPEEMQILIKSWFSILKDYPKEICDAAVIKALKYAKFAPRIGDIVEQIEKMQVALEKNDVELWSELANSLQRINGYVYSVRMRFNALQHNGKTQEENARDEIRREFEALDGLNREYIRNVSYFMELSEMSTDKLGYEKARFIKLMPQIRERAKTRQQLPEGLAGLLNGMALYLTGGVGDGLKQI